MDYGCLFVSSFVWIRGSSLKASQGTIHELTRTSTNKNQHELDLLVANLNQHYRSSKCVRLEVGAAHRCRMDKIIHLSNHTLIVTPFGSSTSHRWAVPTPKPRDDYLDAFGTLLAVTVELDSLNAELPRHQTQMTTLVCLIPVETTPGQPLPVYIFAFVN